MATIKMKKILVTLLVLSCGFWLCAEPMPIKSGYYIMKLKKRDGIVACNIYLNVNDGYVDLINAYNHFVRTFTHLKIENNKIIGTNKTPNSVFDVYGEIINSGSINGYYTCRCVWNEPNQNDYKYYFTIAPDRSPYAPVFWENYLSNSRGMLLSEGIDIADSKMNKAEKANVIMLPAKSNSLSQKNKPVLADDIEFMISGQVCDAQKHGLADIAIDIAIVTTLKESNSEDYNYKRIFTDHQGRFQINSCRGHKVDLRIYGYLYHPVILTFNGPKDLQQLSTSPLAITMMTKEELSQKYDIPINIEGKVVDSNHQPLKPIAVFYMVKSYTLNDMSQERLFKLTDDSAFKLQDAFGNRVVFKVIYNRRSYTFEINGADEIKQWQNKPFIITVNPKQENGSSPN